MNADSVQDISDVTMMTPGHSKCSHGLYNILNANYLVVLKQVASLGKIRLYILSSTLAKHALLVLQNQF